MEKKILYNIVEDLNKHSGRNKSELLAKYISERLDKCVKSYYEDLTAKQNALMYKDPLKVIRRINRG